MNYIFYFIIFLVVIYLSFFGYVKLKYHFWNIQPVFHYYNFSYWLTSDRIVNKDLPVMNKYCNTKDIKIFKYDELNELDKQFIINFLKQHFLRESDVKYIPTIESVESNFKNHVYPSFVSIYFTNTKLFDYKNNHIIDNQDIIGLMTTRPLYITLNNTSFPLYYVDYLCVHNLYRKKGIAPQIIQTHEFNQRHKNKEIKVSLFKREGEINGIVPLSFYYTYGYKKLDVYKIRDASVEIVLVNKASIHYFLDFFKNYKKLFDCVITPHLSNLISLVENKSLYIYLLKQNTNILSCYIFKNTDTLYNNKKSIECISSINSLINDDKKMFYRGFTQAYYNISKLLNLKILLIEDTSHNDQIIKNINTKEPFFNSPTAFFLYNYISTTVKKDKFIYIY